MQIVCPHCTTSYAIDPSKFSEAGRRVRCARCQEVWLAKPEYAYAADEYEPARTNSDDFAQQPASRAAYRENQPHIDSPSISADWPDPNDQQGSRDPNWASAAQHDEAADEPARQSRFHKARHAFARSGVSSKVLGVIPSVNLKTACGVMGAMVVGLMIWRADVVRAMPQTATFFKGIGMGVNLRGLAFEDVKITTENVNNKPVLLIEGAVVGVARKTVEIPRLRFIVRDAKGTDLYAWNAVLEQAALKPGEKAFFKTRLATPPAEGREIAVRFFHRMDIATGGT